MHLLPAAQLPPTPPPISLIHKTEATIIRNEYNNQYSATITMLGGYVGNHNLPMYLAHSSVPHYSRFYLSLYLEVHPKYNWLHVFSNFPNCDVRKGDQFTLHFTDGTVIENTFGVGRNKYKGGVFSNIIQLSDRQLLHLAAHRVHSLNYLHSDVTVEFTDCTFYKNKEEGSELLQIIAKRLVEAKNIILNGTPNHNTVIFA